MKLSFQPYKDLHKRTPYLAVVSFLVQTVSGIREGNEVQVEDESDFNVYASDAAMSSSESEEESGEVPVCRHFSPLVPRRMLIRL